MDSIGFIGFDQLGKQIANQFIDSEQVIGQMVFFDDYLWQSGVSNVFSFKDYLNDEHINLSFVVALGYKHLQLKNAIISQLQLKKRTILSFIHPSCFIARGCEIKPGTIIYPMCTVDFGVSIDYGTLINNSVIISHDSMIGSCCYLSPGVVVSGKVKVGDNCFIGAGSILSDNVTIGNNVTIGIGTVVATNVPDNAFVIGNPMRIVKHIDLK